jgi:hypothetical protein
MSRRLARNPFRGRWRITGIDQWDAECLDREVPAYIEFFRDQGEFQFGTVHGWMDCRYGKRGDLPLVEGTVTTIRDPGAVGLR